MRPEQLQMYDWVLINDTPYQVKQITRKKVGYHRVPHNLDYARSEDVKPIRITAEILEKNGVLSDGVSRWRFCDNENWKIRFSLYYEALRITSENIALEGHVVYVHELQQALRLCGINKKIEL